jgi:hypothetical protein
VAEPIPLALTHGKPLTARRVGHSDEKAANRDSGLGTGDGKWPLDEGQSPNFHGVRVRVSTGYPRVEGNPRA